MGILQAISNGLRATAEFFGWARQRDAEKNAPDVKAAAKSSQEQAQVDKTNKAIANKDVDEIRRQLAE